jgi:hypothetical protein
LNYINTIKNDLALFNQTEANLGFHYRENLLLRFGIAAASATHQGT